MFSIIIPVYNGQKYIYKCIQSILDQSYQDYEIILVDDGSTDQSWQVAGKLAERVSQLTCIHTERHGTGAARNIGLDHASGDYILFMDVDDYWLNPSLLEILQDKIIQHETDVYMYQMLKVTEDGEILEKYRKERFYHDQMVLGIKDVYQDLVRSGQVLASCCNKCIRRELLEHYEIRFLEDVYAEDIDWVIHLFSHAKTICLMNLDAYAYVQHKEISRSNISEAPDDIVKMIQNWSARLASKKVPHARAVAGFLAFEYGICMGNYQYLSKDSRKVMRDHEYLLKYGLDRKTWMIYRFHSVCGYPLTCRAIRFYLFLRKIL